MRQLSPLIISLLLCATCLAQPDSRPGPYTLTKAKWQAVLTGTKTASYIVDGSGACRALVAGDIPDLLATYAAASHTHAASAITSGALALARGGTGVDLSASGGATHVLAQDASHVISARALVAADIPTHNVSLSNITSGTLGTTLALGTQVVTSTGNTTWYNATGKSIQMGINSIPALSVGTAFGSMADIGWAVGRYGAGTADATAAGIGSNSASHIYSNVATGGQHHLMFNNGEKYRFAAALAEFDRLSLGGTIGSSTDPGAGGLALTNRIQFAGAGTGDDSKTQIYSDANAGNLFLGTPTGKGVYCRVNGYNLLWVTNQAVSMGSSSVPAADFSLTLDNSNAYNFINFKTAGIQQGFIQSGTGLISYNFNSHLFRSGAGSLRATVDSSGLTVNSGNLILSTSSTPASNGTGTAGQIAWDANYIYVCTATNTWKRAALTGGY